MGNPDPNLGGNPDPTPEPTPTPTPEPTPEPTPAPEFSWKAKVGADLSKAPALGKFEDTPEGLAGVAKSYVELEQLLSHDKIPMPKGADDLEGIANFNKAMGVPEAAEGYNLADAELPEGMAETSFDKEGFQAIVHKHGLTPAQAEGLWKEYTEMSGNMYSSHLNQFQETLNTNINKLRAEWGDTYPAQIELGDMVINKFADDQEAGDFLTSALCKNPAGLKFLAKIGAQFSENKIGEFQYKRFAMTPEEAGKEVTRIKADPNHAYGNANAPQDDHDQAVAHVNRLIAMSMGKQV